MFFSFALLSLVSPYLIEWISDSKSTVNCNPLPINVNRRWSLSLIEFNYVERHRWLFTAFIGNGNFFFTQIIIIECVKFHHQPEHSAFSILLAFSIEFRNMILFYCHASIFANRMWFPDRIEVLPISFSFPTKKKWISFMWHEFANAFGYLAQTNDSPDTFTCGCLVFFMLNSFCIRFCETRFHATNIFFSRWILNNKNNSV